jgi:hypothetical protein
MLSIEKTVLTEDTENHDIEGEDEVSELKSDFESLNFKFKKRHQQMFSLNNFSLQTNEANETPPATLNSPTKFSKKNIQTFNTSSLDESNQTEQSEITVPNSHHSQTQPEALSEEEEEEMKRKARIERFLSICDIPQSVLYYTQQKFQQISELNAKNSKQKLTPSNKQQAVSSKQQKNHESKNKNKAVFEKGRGKKSKSPMSWLNQNSQVRYYHNGSSLPQQHKKEIIFDIISNYDPENYLQEFKNSLVIEIKLDKK